MNRNSEFYKYFSLMQLRALRDVHKFMLILISPIIFSAIFFSCAKPQNTMLSDHETLRLRCFNCYAVEPIISSALIDDLALNTYDTLSNYEVNEIESPEFRGNAKTLQHLKSVINNESQCNEYTTIEEDVRNYYHYRTQSTFPSTEYCKFVHAAAFPALFIPPTDTLIIGDQCVVVFGKDQGRNLVRIISNNRLLLLKKRLIP